MAEQASSAIGTSRHRVLRACEPCKTRKKRCDGMQPCATCVRYSYQCYFSAESRSRLRRALRPLSSPANTDHVSHPTPASPEQPSRRHTGGIDGQARAQEPASQEPVSREPVSREAVSYGAFSRLLADRLQASHEGDLTSQAIRSTPALTSLADSDATLVQPLPAVLSLDQVQLFAAVFFDSVHPVYTFIRSGAIEESIAARFSSTGGLQSHDAILFGIAALGSLYSEGFAAGQQNRHTFLARNAQTCLDAETARTVTPSFDLIAALVLKTIYMRSTARPYATWITSCTTMHTIAMMDIDLENLSNLERSHGLCSEPRQTLWIARLLNTWIANEFGRPPVTTRFGESLVPPAPEDPVSATPGEQMIYLYRVGKPLESESRGNPEELEASITELAVLDAQQCHDGVLLSRAVMAFCFHRLLRSSDTTDLKRQTFERLVQIGLDGLHAARRLAQKQKPWWHLANAPFQFLCAMLVIDTSRSFAQIPAALQAFQDVAQAMPSSAITEALNLATKLVTLSKRQKTEQLQYLDQCSEHTSTSQESVPDPDDAQMQLPMAGLSVPWQMPDTEALEFPDSLDWSFLPYMDIPIFDMNG